jgi:hypothetical protein
MIWVKRPFTLYTIDLNWIITPRPLVILTIRIINRTSLACYAHYLRLVASTLQVRVNVHLFRFLTPLIFCIFIYFKMGR